MMIKAIQWAVDTGTRDLQAATWMEGDYQGIFIRVPEDVVMTCDGTQIGLAGYYRAGKWYIMFEKQTINWRKRIIETEDSNLLEEEQ